MWLTWVHTYISIYTYIHIHVYRARATMALLHVAPALGPLIELYSVGGTIITPPPRCLTVTVTTPPPTGISHIYLLARPRFKHALVLSNKNDRQLLVVLCVGRVSHYCIDALCSALCTDRVLIIVNTLLLLLTCRVLMPHYKS